MQLSNFCVGLEVSLSQSIKCRIGGRKQSSRNLRNGINHIQPHLHGVPRMISTRFRKTRHAVVAVAKYFYPQTFVFLKYENYF